MKLRQKGAWSVQYSAALAGNEGYNKDVMERQHRQVSSISIGSSPAPVALGLAETALVFGHRTFFYNVASGGAPQTITLDTSIDWRDRFVTGICLYRLSGGAAYLPGGSSDDKIAAPNGDMTANAFGWYTEKGLPVKCAFIGVSVDHYIYADSSNGNLKLYIEATVSSYAVDVNMDYSPKLGRMNLT